MDTPAERKAAYAEFLAGLADLREDLATGRFDALVAALEAEGRLERGDAARLRYWQRESLRTQADQLVSAAASSLAALDRARAEAAAAVASADAIWDTARPTSAAPAASEPATAPAHTGVAEPTKAEPLVVEPVKAAPDVSPESPPASMPEADLTIVLSRAPEPATSDGAAETESPAEPAPEAPAQTSARGRHRAPAHAAPSDSSRSGQGGEIGIERTTAPARRRRLLVAGLTVVDNSDVPPETPAVG